MNCQSHFYRGQDPRLVTRRWFFEQCGVGLGALALSGLFGGNALAKAAIGGTNPLAVGSSRVDLQACKLEYSIVSPK